MKAQRRIKILLVLLALGLGAGISGASKGVAEEHSAAQAVVHEQHQAVPDGGGEADVPVAHAENGHAAATDAHGKGHGGVHKAPMITAEKLQDLFWRAINFAALVFLLVKFLGKPLAGSLSGRRREIEEELKTMQDKRDDAERSYKKFEAQLAGMEEEMGLIISRAIALANDEKTRILTEAEKSAREIRRQAEAAVQAAVAAARNRLQAEAVEQAVAMAEELIVKNLTLKDQVAITEQYLEKVGAVH